MNKTLPEEAAKKINFLQNKVIRLKEQIRELKFQNLELKKENLVVPTKQCRFEKSVTYEVLGL